MQISLHLRKISMYNSLEIKKYNIIIIILIPIILITSYCIHFVKLIVIKIKEGNVYVNYKIFIVKDFQFFIYCCSFILPKFMTFVLRLYQI